MKMECTKIYSTTLFAVSIGSWETIGRRVAHFQPVGFRSCEECFDFLQERKLAIFLIPEGAHDSIDLSILYKCARAR